MEYGMTLPTMARGYTAATTPEWCAAIDAGPYVSLSAGERVTFHNQEQIVTLSAAAALTSRVRVVSTITILPMHPIPLVAKRAATLDVLSGGRLTLGLGVGGREDDYRAAGASFDHRLARLDAGVAELRRLWAGEPPAEGSAPVGPPPSQDGGPPLYSSSLGPKSMARGARWADGYLGFTLAADPTELRATARQVRQAWQDAGRPDAPRLVTSFWFSLGPDARERHERYVRDYMAIDPDVAEFMAGAATLWTEDAVARAIDAVAGAGFDELMFVPTTTDVAELDRLAPLL